MPFATAWMGENHFASIPVAFFGLILLLSGVAYSILSKTLIKIHGHESVLSKAVGKSTKEKISAFSYFAAIPISLYQPLISCLIYLGVAIMWLIPDKRIERVLNDL